MKKVLISFALFVGVSVSAEAAIQTFSASDTGGATRTKLNSNFSELDTTKETKAVVQASAPADTSVDWYDTDQENGVLILKRHNGTAWIRASSHGVQYATSCAGITGGMCVDTDDGKLYYYNGSTVAEVGSGGDYTLPTASGSVLGGVKIGSRLTITGGVLSADVQSGAFDPTADIDFTGTVDFTGATVTGIIPVGTENQIPVYNSSGALTAATPLTPVAGSNITLTTDDIAGTVTIASTGGAAYPGAGIPQSTGSAWGTSITPGTGVATALAAAIDGTGGLASKAALDAVTAGSFAFDTYPTYEDSPHSGSGVAVNGTTLAVYSSTVGKWLTVGLTDSLDPTPDTAPDAFTFGTTQTNATLSTQYCSSPVTPTGYTSAATIVSTGTGANKGWKIDGGSFATTGTISPGSAIQTCHDSSSSNSTSTTSSLTIGGVAATAPFTITTAVQSIVSYSDNFDRANEDPLSGSGVWTNPGGSYYVLKVESNAVTSMSGNGIAYYATASHTFTADQYSQVKVTTNDNAFAGPVARFNPGTSYYYQAGIYYGAAKISRVRGDGNSASWEVAAGQSIAGKVLKLTATGSSPVTLKLYIDGVQIGSDVVDSSAYALTSGQPGIGTTGTGVIDNWQAGEL